MTSKVDTSDAALLALAGRLSTMRDVDDTLRAIVAERQAGVQVKPLVWTEFANIDASPHHGKHGDNLAVALCSYFDRHNECPDGDEDGAELDDYDCWKVWVSENAEAVLRRIATKANDLMEARIRAALKGPNDD